MANVTGTPKGKGAREVGSSLAGRSNPSNISYSLSPFTSPPQRRRIYGPSSGASSSTTTNYRRTIDGSLEMNELCSKKPSTHHNTTISPRNADPGPSRERINQLPPDIRKHREDLVQYSLLPAPSFTEPKHLSLPLDFMASASSQLPIKIEELAPTTVTKTRPEANRAPYAPWNTTDRIIRKPSPCRRRNPDIAPLDPVAANFTQDHHANDDLDGIRGRAVPSRPIVRPLPLPRTVARAGSPHLRHIPRTNSPHLLQVPRQSRRRCWGCGSGGGRRLLGLSGP